MQGGIMESTESVKNQRRAVIIGAAAIGNYDKIASYLQPDKDFYIYCDGGLFHQRKLEACCGRELSPNLIVGDFDSYQLAKDVSVSDFPCQVIHLPREKDDTDTWFAVKEALHRGFTDFLLLGVVGQRLDHSLGNLSILLYLHQQGMQAQLLDDFSQMEIVGNTPVSVSADFSYFSLLNISGLAKEVTIKNAVYPLDKAEISCTYQYAISNQVLPGQVTEITVGQGSLLLIKVW